jgi:hypothetical protein
MGGNKSEFFSEKGLAQGMEIGRLLPAARQRNERRWSGSSIG